MSEEIKAFDKLNDRQKDFVLNYIRCRVATKAYLEAYSGETNELDYESAAAMASRLLNNVNISEAIREKINEIWNEKEKEIGSIFDELKALGYSDINNVMEYKDGMLIPRDFDKIDTRAIKKIKIKRIKESYSEDEEVTTATDIIEIELHDKKGSLAELADILGIKKKQLEISGAGFVNIIVEGVTPESDNNTD